MPLDHINGAHQDGSDALSVGAHLRAVNERIREVAGRFGDEEPGMYVCECDDSECLAPVTMTVEEYDAARSLNPTAPLLAHHRSAA